MSGGTHLTTARRVIVKIGSALLVDQETGAVNRRWLAALANDVVQFRARGQEVVIVSSGAIAVGRRHLGLGTGQLRLEESQAAAATGMVRLAHAYQEVLAEYDLTLAQVLVTLDDSENRRRYINARNTLETLLKLGAVPLINGNDTVATDEIRFGDNDTPQLQPIQVRPTASPRQLAKQTPRPRSRTSAVGGASALSSDPSLASACSRLLAHVSKLCNHALRPISHARAIPCLPPRLLARRLLR